MFDVYILMLSLWHFDGSLFKGTPPGTKLNQSGSRIVYMLWYNTTMEHFDNTGNLGGDTVTHTQHRHRHTDTHRHRHRDTHTHTHTHT